MDLGTDLWLYGWPSNKGTANLIRAYGGPSELDLLFSQQPAELLFVERSMWKFSIAFWITLSGLTGRRFHRDSTKVDGLAQGVETPRGYLYSSSGLP